MSNTGKPKKAMRAWAIAAYGGPEQMRLMELPVPKPEPRDVLIRMRGGEVGDWDALVRQGGWPMKRPFPLVLGLAGAGTVAAVGNEVLDFEERDHVYAYNYPMRHEGCPSLDHNGAWAEYMLVPASYVARAPATLDLPRAGSVPIVGLTAHETLTDILEVRPGEVVLITAASGGVGHLAVQIAAHLKAHVVATTSRHNFGFVSALGAETVIDYQKEDVVTAVRKRYPKGVDKALNGVAGETADEIVRTLRPGGRMVDLTGSASVEVPDVTVETDYVVQANAGRLTRIARMIDGGHLKVKIEEMFPFERAPDALERVLTKHVRGKIGLEIS